MKEEENSIMKDLSGYLTLNQVNRILGSAKSIRDRLLFQLIFRCGRRVSEVLNLKVMHINKDRDSIMFYILKKRKELKKLKAIDSYTMQLIRKYIDLKRLEPDDYLFKSPYREGKPLTRQMAFYLFRDMCERADVHMVGVKKPHPHHLRHSHAIIYLDRNNKASALRMLQMQLEHSSLKQTTHYLQFSEKDQRDALNRVFAGDEK